MSTSILEPQLPQKNEIETAQKAAIALETLSAANPNTQDNQISIKINNQEHELPPIVQKLLLNMIEHIAEGKAISLIPINSELTTQQAADFLNVSRPYLIKLLDEGKIRYTKVGTHRRVIFADLVKYKEQSYKESMLALDELVKEAQELGLGY